jgi:hypothetical protein
MRNGEAIDKPGNGLKPITRAGVPGIEYQLQFFLGDPTDVETISYFETEAEANQQVAAYKAIQGGNLVGVFDDLGISHTNIQVLKVTHISSRVVTPITETDGNVEVRVRWNLQDTNI